MKKDKRNRKYEFASKQELLDKLTLLLEAEEPLTEEPLTEEPLTEVPNATEHYYGLAELGYVITKAGEYDEAGNETKAPTYSDKYSVDIFWRIEEPLDWAGKKIKLGVKKSSHEFLGWEYEDEN